MELEVLLMYFSKINSLRGQPDGKCGGRRASGDWGSLFSSPISETECSFLLVAGPQLAYNLSPPQLLVIVSIFLVYGDDDTFHFGVGDIHR